MADDARAELKQAGRFLHAWELVHLQGPGLGTTLRPEVFERPDVTVQRTEA